MTRTPVLRVVGVDAPAPGSDDGRIQITYISDRHAEIIRETASLLPDIYRRGDDLVTVQDGQIERLSVERLKMLLSDRCRFWGGGSRGRRPVGVPEPLVKGLRASDGFATLRGILRSPTLRPDETVMTGVGFDRASGFWLEVPVAVQVPETPTLEDARRALGTLLAPFGEFPIADEPSKASLVATILSLVSGPVIEGPRPMTVIAAPSPGSGKTLLASALTQLGTGETPAMIPPAEGKELAKTLTAILRRAPRVAILDNVVTLRDPVLAAVLTATRLEPRLMGGHEVAEIEHHCQFLASANNPILSDEIARRTIRIDLASRGETPSIGRSYRIPDLLGHIREHQATYCAAALTILRAHCVAGRPQLTSPLGSFEAWDRVVRQCVLWLGLADPVSTQARSREQDPRREAHAVFLRAWRAKWGDAPTLLRDVLREATASSALQESLETLTGKDRVGAQHLGFIARRLMGVTVDGLRLVARGHDRTGTQQWAVIAEGGDR